MLRVHQPDLARRHAEERRVESRNVVDETGTTRHDLAGRIGIRVEEFVYIPAVLRHLRYRVAALAQHVPEPAGVLGTRETRCIADDCKARGRLDRMFGGSHAVVLPCGRRSESGAGGHCIAPEVHLPDGDYSIYACGMRLLASGFRTSRATAVEAGVC